MIFSDRNDSSPRAQLELVQWLYSSSGVLAVSPSVNLSPEISEDEHQCDWVLIEA